jgi:hypothetical protein
VQILNIGEDTTMTVRELRAALAMMEANSTVQVVLFKNDGTNQVFGPIPTIMSPAAK